MKEHLENQRGAIDVVLIAVVFVATVALGGYVYYQQRQAQNGYDKAGTGVTISKHIKKAKPAPDPTASWTAFTSVKGKFSLKYPPAWVVPTHKELCNDGMFDRAIYLGPTAGTVLHCATEYFGMMAVSSTDGDHRADNAFDGTTYGSIVKAAVTVDGVAGERSTATVTTVPDGPVTMKVGDKEIRYVFFTNGITYVATYAQQAANPDVSADFDTMIKSTLKFN